MKKFYCENIIFDKITAMRTICPNTIQFVLRQCVLAFLTGTGMFVFGFFTGIGIHMRINSTTGFDGTICMKRNLFYCEKLIFVVDSYTAGGI